MIKAYRCIRVLNIFMMVSSGFYVHRLFNSDTIVKSTLFLLVNIIFAGFFFIDLIITLLSKETFAYYIGVNKERMPKLYNFWIGFDIVMVFILMLLIKM